MLQKHRDRIAIRGSVGKLGIVMTGKSSCKLASHKLLKDRAKNRVDDLQGMFSDLQYARNERRSSDVAVLEEQVHQMLREWKAELHEPSPANSVQEGSMGTFSLDICRLLQVCEEEDDATSKLTAPKPEPDNQNLLTGENVIFHEGHNVNQMPQQHNFQLGEDCKGSASGAHNMPVNNLEGTTHLDSYQFQSHQNFEQSFFTGLNNPGLYGEEAMFGFMSNVIPPPSAFLGPKCALWDCPRPAQGLDWAQEYCSSFHAALAMSEGPPGMIPVVRPGGIGLKDGLLFAALSAKTLGKDVGIPECEGAATTKSPWNAPELFDTMVLKGETIREWLFFDKPRRAFESGNRKQRSLPDYNGRGWHESRKQVMNDFGGLKRSYYMDPQPLTHYEWHLYEYEINKCTACALYRLELKQIDAKKGAKGKPTTDSVSVLEKQMGRLSAEVASDNKRSVKGKTNSNSKAGLVNNVYDATTNQVGPTSDALDYGAAGPPYNYYGENLSNYFLT